MATGISSHEIGSSGGSVPIWRGDSWALLTIVAHSTGVTIASIGTQNALMPPNALVLPVDTPIDILMAPGSTVFAGAQLGGVFSVVEQPLPFIAQLALTVQRWLGMRAA